MISVVMATYNGSKYLTEQILSLMNQTILPDEVIISDDGSQDNTIKILEDLIEEFKIQYPSVKFILHQNKENQGYINNFLNAVMMSKGDIVFLADQDDIWKENKIKDMCECMSKHHAKAIHSDIDVINEDKEMIQHKWEKYNFDYRLNKDNQFLKKLNYCGMSMCFDGAYIRACIPQIRKLDIPTHDWAICACADIANAFLQMGDVFTLRRYHEDNVALKMNQSYQGNSSERIKLLKKYLHYYEIYAEMQNILGSNKHSDYIQDMISLTKTRIFCVQERKILKALFNVIHIKNYPSYRAYIGDLMYILNFRKFIRKTAKKGK